MADKRDYYEVLGVDKNADADTIKKAYRKIPFVEDRTGSVFFFGIFIRRTVKNTV